MFKFGFVFEFELKFELDFKLEFELNFELLFESFLAIKGSFWGRILTLKYFWEEIEAIPTQNSKILANQR